MLVKHGVERRRIHLARAEPFGLDRRPAVSALVLVLLQHEIPLVAAVELPHGREALLNTLKEVEDRLPLARKIHFSGQVHVDVEIVGKRRILRHT